jgi:hypothetical protein
MYVELGHDERYVELGHDERYVELGHNEGLVVYFVSIVFHFITSYNYLK